MDPSSFTKTSFCGHQVDNITKNEDKKCILDKLKIQSNGLTYTSRYAKIYNDQFSKNLSNPHILCLKSSGTPYLLYVTQINDINYTFLIDKKMKQGYDYPKIFVIPYQFHNSLYNGTLFETELLRDKYNKWSLLLGDIYMYLGESITNKIIIDRVNIIHNVLEDQFIENDFLQICSIQVKKYFDLKDISYVVNEFSKKLRYDIRGLYFIPLKPSYSNVLFLYPKKQNQVNRCKQEEKYVFRIIKTPKPDVYELYSKGEYNLIKKGYAYVKDIKQSMFLYTLTNTEKDVNIVCKYNDRFKKWEPLSETTEMISLSKDILV
jgi:hypothetical protein